MPKNAIAHHPHEQRFVLPVDDREAVLEYRLSSAGPGNAPTSVDFTRTYVPSDLRGQGLAEALVRHGLKWARARDYKIDASCWYVAKFLR